MFPVSLIFSLEIAVVVKTNDVRETIGHSPLEDLAQDFSNLLFDCSLDSSLDILLRILDSLMAAAVIVVKAKEVVPADPLALSALQLMICVDVPEVIISNSTLGEAVAFRHACLLDIN